MKTNKLIFIFLYLTFACNNSSSDTNIEKNVLKGELPILVSKVNELRLRSEPNKTSKVLYVVGEKEEVFFLNEKTDFKETIKMRGVNYTEPWLKVRTKDGIEGWVFGGGLQQNQMNIVGNEDVQKKKIKNMSAKELSKILNLEIDSEYPNYNGFYHYYLTANNAEILHGEFALEGEKKAEEIGMNIGIKYIGNYINGTKNGEFEEISYYWDSSNRLILYYEASNECLWGKADLFSEFESLLYTIEKPSDCTFSFIEEQANKYGKWVDATDPN